ncbi:glucose 1-dehydrogenase [Burkholderia cepacia]|uniref:glucose 1-dehydrogenase n=1 Tax=Burkholderia cepacia TaxID=292 RepID=UPI000F5B2A69|nr:glucose 1-dehydrogenase [Burkholderia cepacia]RQT44146.1 SDR family NAD(P)-dependent oxidoreductase [Burkholderia cepacia]
MKRLEGKVALITGAARGQGEAEARRFVAEGARVVIADVLDDAGRRVAAELGAAARFQHLDVTSEAGWQAAVDATLAHFGRLDILVNNAAILKLVSIEACSLDDYRKVIDVNQVGCWLGMKSAVAALKEAGGGSIVNVSSTAGMEGVAGGSAYVSSKFAVRGMTKAAALEFGRYGIRVNSVHPGGIDTVMARPPEFADFDPSSIYSGLPIARIGKPGEVASLVLFLASDESAYCTGSEFIVDGGMLAGSTFH